MFTFPYYFFLMLAVLIGVGSAIIVLVTRTKSLRIVFGSVFFVVMVGFVLNGLDNRRRANAEALKIIGVYKLDVTRSLLTGYDSTLYQNVTLHLNEDRTFTIDPDVPFLLGTEGTWKIDWSLDESTQTFYFPNIDTIGFTREPFETGREGLIIRSPSPKYGLLQAQLIHFVKK